MTIRGLASALAASLRLASAETSLPAGGAKAEPAGIQEAYVAARSAAHSVQSALARQKDLDRLRGDLRAAADELDEELAGAPRDLAGYSVSLERRLRRLRRRRRLDPRLDPVLDLLDQLYRDLPRGAASDEYAQSLLRHVHEELRWIAETSAGEAQILAAARADLRLRPDPDAWLPQNVPLSRYRRLGPIRIFLMKHRRRHPASPGARLSPQEVVGGKSNAQVYVETVGRVTGYRALQIDLDTTFNFGDLHCEIPPEWRKSHPRMPLPKTGDLIRVRGWTYYDYFHKTEAEYDAADPELGIRRTTLWELHPVQEIEILPPGAPSR